MSSASSAHAESAPATDRRELIRHAVEHLDHVLPGQAPILDFVHHNTLHGYQHLPFAEALAAVEQLTGIRAYLPDGEFRKFHRAGRILDEDLDAALRELAGLRAGAPVAGWSGRPLTRREIFRVALVHGAEPVTPGRLAWLIEARGALEHWQEDLPEDRRRRWLAGAPAGEAAAVRELWEACLATLGFSEFVLHPEELLDLSAERAEALLDRSRAGMAESAAVEATVHRRMRGEARERLGALWDDLGEGLSLRGLLLALTGRDALDAVRPILARIGAAQLDEGLAAWHPPDRGAGLYAAWRRFAAGDCGPAMGGAGAAEPPPADATDAIVAELDRLGLPEARWAGYLRRLALELPGWSGLINWRQHHPDYAANAEAPVSLLDHLAIRLVLDREALEPACLAVWGVPARLPALRAHFERNLSEFLVRQALFEGRLPEYLADQAEAAIAGAGSERRDRENWRLLADLIFTWKHSPAADTAERLTPGRDVWRLFRLAQHLELSGAELRGLPPGNCEALLAVLDELDPARRGALWLAAYERRYREELFNALANNRGRGRWASRAQRPEAQLVFCMDDREEGIRRHLEELNPRLETLGAAGFFGIAMNWRGLDDAGVSALCPVVVVPSHEVREVPRPGLRDLKDRHDRRLALRRRLSAWFHQELRRNLWTSALAVAATAPGVLLALLGRLFAPRSLARHAAGASARLVPEVPTRLYFTADFDGPASPAQPRLGFTDAEQAERVGGFLRNVGLTHGFAPLVVLMGHGSGSDNNPHRAAYACGACSGRHGGPNGRAFAAMANRPEVRALLAERGIAIPADTWFVGAEHNTCDEDIQWYDEADLPAFARTSHDRLKAELEQARRLSAHERCRRLASAPRAPTPDLALAHMAGRAVDFSQARPELGHATNAAAVVGRRSLSRGAFLDRRVFLISYDPTQDPDGAVLEGILLAVGPVGAGINLEYYFSTVNNERFGCGTKVPHNVTGLFGVMEGTASDLRTGLPRQMIEIHEAMRLQLVVEHKTGVLAAIYARQPPIRELVGNGWVHLTALDPDTGAISRFVPGHGFVAWEEKIRPLPLVERSADWYAGHTEPLWPALIRRPDGAAAA